MSTFKDALGREWTFSITVLEVKQLRKEVDVDLLDFVSPKAEELFNRLATDPILLVDVMSLLLTEQITRLGLDERGFAQGLRGEGLDRAAEALVREVANFFDPHRGSLILAGWKQVVTAMQTATAIGQRRLESLDVPAMTAKKFDEAFARVQEKFGV